MTLDDRAAQKTASAAKRNALLESARINRGLEESLASKEGRAFLWWLLGIAGYGQQPHTGNALNTAFKCGGLEVANHLLLRIAEVDPAGFVRMQLERIENVNPADPDTNNAGTIASDIGPESAESGEWGRDSD